jgi:hypothetical protein
MKTIIGIDLSLNSTGICILRENSVNLVSVFKTDNNIEKIFSRNDHFTLLGECSELKMILKNKELDKSKEYHIREREKISNFVSLANEIKDAIIESIGDDDDVYIGMEGISFGSPGNSLIDISMLTGILRSEILKILGNDSGRFFVFSPTAIKKFAGKGNFKKIDMYDSLCSQTEVNSEFITLIKEKKEMMVTKSGTVKKPTEDIIDSIWVARFLKNEVESNNI